MREFACFKLPSSCSPAREHRVCFARFVAFPVDPLDPLDPVDPVDPLDPLKNSRTGDTRVKIQHFGHHSGTFGGHVGSFGGHLGWRKVQQSKGIRDHLGSCGVIWG